MSVNEFGQRSCSVCGAQVNQGDRFCPSCGSPQEWPETATPRPTEPGEPPAETDPWLIDTRPSFTLPPPASPEPEAPRSDQSYSQAAWTPPPAPRSSNRTWWIIGGLALLFLVVCCCCAFLVFVTASQDTALREELEGTAHLLSAMLNR